MCSFEWFCFVVSMLPGMRSSSHASHLHWNESFDGFDTDSWEDLNSQPSGKHCIALKALYWVTFWSSWNESTSTYGLYNNSRGVQTFGHIALIVISCMVFRYFWCIIIKPPCFWLNQSWYHNVWIIKMMSAFFFFACFCFGSERTWRDWSQWTNVGAR